MINSIEEAIAEGVSPEMLAQIFMKEHFGNEETVFPINPFKILTELEIPFTFRPFKIYEGIYIPASDKEDLPIIGINIDRPITRQRYTAAHELCHHIKDVKSGFLCNISDKSEIEQYAEKFAAALLMPIQEIKKRAELYARDGYVDNDGVLMIANFFGVSFQACLIRIAYSLHMIDGDLSPAELKKRASKYRPEKKKVAFGLNDVILYEQLFDFIKTNLYIQPNEYTCRKFKNEYIYFDSRMEGVEVEQEMVSEIIADIREFKQESQYCNSKNQNIIEIAGLAIVYEKVFEMSLKKISIYNLLALNSILYSCAPYPDAGGHFRNANTLVSTAKFETLDYNRVSEEIKILDCDLQNLLNDNNISISKYIEDVVKMHYRLTVIHAFPDGNGRTARAFTNILLLKRGIPPVFFKDIYSADNSKKSYKNSLRSVDEKGEYSKLYENFFRAILQTHVILSDFNL